MPSVAQTLTRALELHQAGELSRAEELYRGILRIDAGCADALHLLGVAAFQQGKNDAAEDLISRAIVANGRAAPFHNNLGNVRQRAGRLNEASDCFEQAIRCRADFADAHYNLATVRKQQGRLDEALRSFRETLSINSEHLQAWNNQGLVLKELGRTEEAAGSYRRALELNPDFPEALNNLGVLLHERGEFDEAAACLERAILLQLDYVDAHFNFGNLHRDGDRLEVARDAYLRALAIDAGCLQARSNLGIVLKDLGQPEAAIQQFNRVLESDPQHVEAHVNRAYTLRLTGDLEAGWDEYEWRWRAEEHQRQFSQPLWDGSSLSGRRILIYGEQGIGDEIFFASCFPEVLEQAAETIIECLPRLVPLFARSFPQAAVYPAAADPFKNDNSHLPPFDLQSPSGSLPRILRRTFDAFPDRPGFLIADAQRTAEWKRRFAELGAALTVGISWRGGKREEFRRRRSTTLEEWRPVLSVPGVAFVNLQYGDCREDLAAVKETIGVTIHDWAEPDPLIDMDGFAAQVAALDLVISIDNSTVHLAGALGVPVWTLLPFSPDWRWMLGRTDSPWYPRMRLFRQRVAGAWEGVFQTVADNLRHCKGVP